MELSNTITTGSIVVVRFPADEVVIGEVVEISPTTLTLKDPCKLSDMIHPDTGDPMTYIKLWNRFSVNDQTVIKTDNLLGVSLAGNRVCELLRSYLSSLDALKNDTETVSGPSLSLGDGDHDQDSIMEYVSARRAYYHVGNDTVH
jgi:hypothetical protein